MSDLPGRRSSLSATTSRPTWSPTTTWPSHRHQRRVDPEPRRHQGAADRRDDESVVDMAEAAGAKALAASGLEPSDIDLVIVATCTPESQIPNAAARSPTGSASTAPGAFDLNAACAGFCYALAPPPTRSARARARTCWSSARRSCPRGSTGPTGPPASSSPTAPGPPWSARRARRAAGIGPVVWGSAGDKADAITSPSGHPSFCQEGQAVFRWATTAIAPGGDRGVRARRGDSRRHLRRSSRTRPTCASSRRSPGSSASRATASPTTSSRRATPRRPRSRSPCRG